MKDIVLIGSGGCMRELAWQIYEDGRIEKKWQIIGYVDLAISPKGKDIKVGMNSIPFLGDDNFLLMSDKDLNIVVSIGDPEKRKKIAEKYMVNSHLHFPNIVIGNTYVCDDLTIGKGCIISMDCRISTNVKLGDFAFLNTGSMVCHDSILGDFVTLSPDVKIAGEVRVGNSTEVGMGAKIIQGVSVGNNVIIGAGSVVINNVGNGCTIVGVPAKVRG